MKIAVITMHAVKNYGSVLQTYATQKVLTKIGYEVKIINFIRKKNLDSNLLNTWTINNKGVKRILKKFILLPTVYRWKKVFESYLDENVNLTPDVYTSEKELKLNLPEADIFCTGSDQVWNSGWNNGIEKSFYLSFVPDYVPKIAIAASIGKSDLSDSEMDEIRPLLKRYNHISMREISGVNILRKMGFDNVSFCLDPTLLVSKEEWLSYSIPTRRREKYVLIYQLNHDVRFDKYAIEFARRKKMKLYRICTRYDQIRLPGIPIMIPEVRELLSIINDAEYVITNSFHITAFCINFNKQFVSIYPNEYSCRISDILKLFSLEDRHLSNYDQYEIAEKKIDFSISNKRLRDYRAESLEMIRNMLEEIKL